MAKEMESKRILKEEQMNEVAGGCPPPCDPPAERPIVADEPIPRQDGLRLKAAPFQRDGRLLF